MKPVKCAKCGEWASKRFGCFTCDHGPVEPGWWNDMLFTLAAIGVVGAIIYFMTL